MVRAVVFFDVDGTLVPHTSSGQHLADRLGHADVMRRAEARYASGTMTNKEVAILDARGWAGRTPADVCDLLGSLPVVEGIGETVEWCLRHDVAPVLATLAWQTVGDHLCQRFGFTEACGPALDVVEGRYSGEVARHLDEFGKRDFALAHADKLGLTPGKSAAVGDSRSDIPLFASVGLAIAFNATPDAREAADTTLDGNDLRDAVPLIGTWLTTLE